VCEPSHVTARPGKVRDDADTFRIGNTNKDHRNRICRLPHSVQDRRSEGNDDSRCRGHKFGHDGAHFGRLCPPIDDVDIAPLDQTKLRASRFKHAPCSLPARSDKPDKDDRGIASFLLSARCKWPRGGASDQANELASPHLTHRERVVLNFWTITFSIGPVRGLRRNNVLHCKSVQGHRRPQPRWPKARLASPSEPSYTVPLFGFADRGARAASPGRAKVVNDTGC